MSKEEQIRQLEYKISNAIYSELERTKRVQTFSKTDVGFGGTSEIGIR